MTAMQHGKYTYKILVSSLCEIPLLYMAIWAPTFAGTFPFIPLIFLAGIITVHNNAIARGILAVHRKKATMDSYMTYCVTLTAGYGIWLTVAGKGAAAAGYCASAGLILSLYAAGLYLEAKAIRTAEDAGAKRGNFLPDTAIVIRDGFETIVPTDSIAQGDIVVIHAREVIAVDGIIVVGETTIDASAVAGEHTPARKVSGDRVWSGSFNIESPIRILAGKVRDDTTIADIQRLVKKTNDGKTPESTFANRFGGRLMIVTVAIEIVAASACILLDRGIEAAIGTAIGLLAVISPATLAIAEPLAIRIGSAAGARRGIFIASVQSLAKGKPVDAVVFNSRGTVTEGMPSVTDIISLSELDDNDLLQIAASIQCNSEFTPATAIVHEARRSGLRLTEPERFQPYPGKGVEAIIRRKSYYAGGPVLLQENGIDVSSAIPHIGRLAQQGKMPFMFGCDGKLLGIIAVADAVKTGSKETIADMIANGIEIVMLTNENEKTAEGLREITGASKVFTEFTPGGKADIIRKLREKGRTVAMVGGGINDAPALAAASVSIKIGKKKEPTIAPVDVCIENGYIGNAYGAIKLCGKVRAAITQNTVIAFAFGGIGIAATLGDFGNRAASMTSPLLQIAITAAGAAAIALNSLKLGLFRNRFAAP